MVRKINMAIFASGAGSNADKIITHLKNNKYINVALVVSSKKEAGVLKIAENNQIPSIILNRSAFFNTDDYIHELASRKIDIIILAGFLWKVPENLVRSYQNKIINIHPALLPKYGGKGMYGDFVHEAVIAAKESVSGITIHLVDEVYDHGKQIFQATCEVAPEDSAADLAAKIHQLEHQHFPLVIEQYVLEHPDLFG